MSFRWLSFGEGARKLCFISVCSFLIPRFASFLGFFLHLGTGRGILVLNFKRHLKQGALSPTDTVHSIFPSMADFFLLVSAQLASSTPIKLSIPRTNEAMYKRYYASAMSLLNVNRLILITSVSLTNRPGRRM